LLILSQVADLIKAKPKLQRFLAEGNDLESKGVSVIVQALSGL
jgi:hypothetical protein